MDLLTTSRTKILETVRTTGASAQCVLLTDEDTLRILSSGVRMSELLEAAPHIVLIESLFAPLKTRAPPSLAASLDAIYLLSPASRSLHAALADHEPAGGGATPKYGGSAHFIFTRRLPDELMQRLRDSPALPRVATLRELNLHYLPLARTAFSLNAPLALAELYGPTDGTKRTQALQALAEQVCTVYASQGLPAPRVRYSSQAGAHPICKAFAETLESLLRAASLRAAAAAAAAAAAGRTTAGAHGGGAAVSSRSSMSGRRSMSGGVSSRISRRSTLLILERSFDPLTPLLHDFSYEALAVGLGVLDNGRFRRANGKDVLMHESDAVWADLRRRPWVDVADRLKDHSRDFLNDNEAVVKMERGEKL